MDGVLYTDLLNSLKVAGLIIGIFVPMIGAIVAARYLLVDKRTKKNCLDCLYADKSDHGKIYCRVVPPAVYQVVIGMRPHVFLKTNGALYSSADNGKSALSRCGSWRWDGIFSNLKRKGAQLL